MCSVLTAHPRGLNVAMCERPHHKHDGLLVRQAGHVLMHGHLAEREAGSIMWTQHQWTGQEWAGQEWARQLWTRLGAGDTLVKPKVTKRAITK